MTSFPLQFPRLLRNRREHAENQRWIFNLTVSRGKLKVLLKSINSFKSNDGRTETGAFLALEKDRWRERAFELIGIECVVNAVDFA